ncbi:uncharacterized protein MONBRDRAFT_25671 [Monosiga brevicollis MX1]|uniref:Uncharacterized protein n=1 Tax=Monosiga brevicollis TaxID=81824 RepID=A9V029_MONBE|nr:uncharacterized protein MONBRDRAFT_25671 [Monosiga brevicollis MX1]EDQ89085.1 predicted protein [Monosiga brevicollis MX1]|eukprot:XP_001746190.1 hypothetical protein [Monosiga brevicollis MX1]
MALDSAFADLAERLKGINLDSETTALVLTSFLKERQAQAEREERQAAEREKRQAEREERQAQAERERRQAEREERQAQAEREERQAQAEREQSGSGSGRSETQWLVDQVFPPPLVSTNGCLTTQMSGTKDSQRTLTLFMACQLECLVQDFAPPQGYNLVKHLASMSVDDVSFLYTLCKKNRLTCDQLENYVHIPGKASLAGLARDRRRLFPACPVRMDVLKLTCGALGPSIILRTQVDPEGSLVALERGGQSAHDVTLKHPEN